MEPAILVVDDDMKIREMATAFLKSEGMTVYCAASGEEALRLTKENHISLMITDLNMPGMKGFELACRAHEIMPDMPILMFTGNLCGDTQNLAKAAGILKVFEKPSDFLDILKTVKEALHLES